MRKQNVYLWSLLLLCLMALPACQKRMTQADKASSVPYDIKVAVAPFSQPVTTSQLIMGSLPVPQGRVPADVLTQLDSLLRTDLATTKRLYTWLPEKGSSHAGSYHESETPQALPQWVAYGRQFGVDMLVVPQILNWHQREGSGAGVTSSAHVRAEFFLIDVNNGRILRRSIFEEKQEGLANNVLGAGDFFKRGARWVLAEELTREAMAKAIKELGL